jgi:FAD/FMN-containing dehydrogenase
LIATNSLGPLRYGAGGGGGDWRLLVLGMKWVDARGQLLRSGCRTVKNAAGYGVHRMLIGSGGALGVIAEVTLRTFARPPDEQCAILFCETPAQAEAVLAETLLSATTPAYMQLVGGNTFRGNPLGLPRPRGGGGNGGAGMVVIVGFLGRPETCAAQVEIVRRLPAAQGMDAIAQTAAQAGRLRLWMTTEPAISEGGVGMRLHMLSSEAAGVVSELDALDVWAVSEAATGVVRCVCPPASAAVRERLEKLCAKYAPHITQGTFGQGGDREGVAGRLKRVLDPENRFGRW